MYQSSIHERTRRMTKIKKRTPLVIRDDLKKHSAVRKLSFLHFDDDHKESQIHSIDQANDDFAAIKAEEINISTLSVHFDDDDDVDDDDSKYGFENMGEAQTKLDLFEIAKLLKKAKPSDDETNDSEEFGRKYRAKSEAEVMEIFDFSSTTTEVAVGRQHLASSARTKQVHKIKKSKKRKLPVNDEPNCAMCYERAPPTKRQKIDNSQM